MSENQDMNLAEEKVLTDDALEQVTGGKGKKKLKNKRGEDVKTRSRAACTANMEAGADAAGYAEAGERGL